MSRYVPRNRRWRSTPASPTFFMVPVIPFYLTLFSILFIKKLVVVLACVIMIAFSIYLKAKNKSFMFVLKRLYYRFITFNFRQSRIY
jgi:hypothetical protein